MTTYSDYDPFAWVYNRHWGDTFLMMALPVVENLVLKRLSTKARILDLCCGTGQMAAVLTTMGYQVTGIDGSEEMLSFARKNAPKAKFIKADARSFSLPDTYHAVVSVFDSLNHVMSAGELVSVFGNVRTALEDGGLFLFDLNMEEGYRTNWNGSSAIVEDDHVCAITSSYDTDEKIARFDATIFRPENGWRRTDFTLLQKCHSESEVRSALAESGLVEVNIYGYTRKAGMKELTVEAERAFFLYQKAAEVNSIQ